MTDDPDHDPDYSEPSAPVDAHRASSESNDLLSRSLAVVEQIVNAALKPPEEQGQGDPPTDGAFINDDNDSPAAAFREKRRAETMAKLRYMTKDGPIGTFGTVHNFKSTDQMETWLSYERAVVDLATAEREHKEAVAAADAKLEAARAPWRKALDGLNVTILASAVIVKPKE